MNIEPYVTSTPTTTTTEITSNINNVNINNLNTVIDHLLHTLELPEISIEFRNDTGSEWTTPHTLLGNIQTNISGSSNIPSLQALTTTLTDSLSNSLQYMNRTPMNTINDLNQQSTLITLRENNKSQYDDIECSICNQNYEMGDIIRTFNRCSHYFHYNCIDTWLNTNKKCPVCTIEII